MPVTATDMTLADLLQRFGPIPAAGIRYDPLFVETPGNTDASGERPNA